MRPLTMMGALGAKEGVGVGKRHHVASVAGDKHGEALLPSSCGDTYGGGEAEADGLEGGSQKHDAVS